MRPAAALLFLLLGCTKQTDAGRESGGTSSTSSMSTTDRWVSVFSTYPGVRSLCNEHVTGNTMHIVWQSYASKDPPRAVIAHYKSAHPREVDEATDTELTLRGPNDKVLSVRAAGAGHPTCSQAPSSDEKTVIVVSQAIR